mmetsp:Transcript_33336/g.84476  ORF Transcript_33336/g.84476 Transcript_33336/m.84476 type:complete len:262 (+) Transcript_33336:806-1591(+)
MPRSLSTSSRERALPKMDGFLPAAVGGLESDVSVSTGLVRGCSCRRGLPPSSCTDAGAAPPSTGTERGASFRRGRSSEPAATTAGSREGAGAAGAGAGAAGLGCSTGLAGSGALGLGAGAAEVAEEAADEAEPVEAPRRARRSMAWRAMRSAKSFLTGAGATGGSITGSGGGGAGAAFLGEGGGGKRAGGACSLGAGAGGGGGGGAGASRWGGCSAAGTPGFCSRRTPGLGTSAVRSVMAGGCWRAAEPFWYGSGVCPLAV